MASDDQSALFFAELNASSATMIASRNRWTTRRNWQDVGDATSDATSTPISLVTHEPYILEMRQKNCGGGTHASVGVRMPSATNGPRGKQCG